MNESNKKIEFVLENGEKYTTDNCEKLLLIPELLKENIKKIKQYAIPLYSYEYNYSFFNIRPFYEGCARVMGRDTEDRYTYIDDKGEKIAPCIYEYAGDFHEGLALVRKNGKYGYIDKNSAEVIPCIYEDARDFHEGLALVRKNGQYGYINKDGEEIMPCICNWTTNLNEGLVVVQYEKNNPLFYLINLKNVQKYLDTINAITNAFNNVYL